jgi:hypothetical protein
LFLSVAAGVGCLNSSPPLSSLHAIYLSMTTTITVVAVAVAVAVAVVLSLSMEHYYNTQLHPRYAYDPSLLYSIRSHDANVCMIAKHIHRQQSRVCGLPSS